MEEESKPFKADPYYPVGIQVQSPQMFMTLKVADYEPIKLKESWKRYYKLIDRTKRRIGRWRMLLKWVVILILCPLSSALLMLLLFLDQSRFATRIIGFCIPTAWIIIYLMVSDKIETDPYYIKFKHRNKTYR